MSVLCLAQSIEGAVMFTIVVSKGDQVIDTIPWPGMLEPAKIHAVNYVRANDADKVVVLDENDTVLFTYHGEKSA